METDAPHQLDCIDGDHHMQRPLYRLPLHLLLQNEHAPHEVAEHIRSHDFDLAHLRHGLPDALRFHLAIVGAHLFFHLYHI